MKHKIGFVAALVIVLCTVQPTFAKDIGEVEIEKAKRALCIDLGKVTTAVFTIRQRGGSKEEVDKVIANSQSTSQISGSAESLLEMMVEISYRYPVVANKEASKRVTELFIAQMMLICLDQHEALPATAEAPNPKKGVTFAPLNDGKKKDATIDGTIDPIVEKIQAWKPGAAVPKDLGKGAVALVLKDDFHLRAADEIVEKLEQLIFSYVKPLPAADLLGNMEAYQALAKINPGNSNFALKATRYKKALQEEKFSFLKKFKRKQDDFRGLTFYTWAKTPRYSNIRSYFIPYIVVKGKQTSMRFNLHYTNDRWLFVESIAFNIDGEIVKFPRASGDWKRDNGSGDIWEWKDVVVDGASRDLLKRIAYSKKTVARLNGSTYYDDVTVTASDKTAMKAALTAYDVISKDPDSFQ